MTDELIALVAILSNDGIPEGNAGAAVELHYWRHDEDAYRRAVDVLDRCGLLTAGQVERETFQGSEYERIVIGNLKLVGPTGVLAASETFGKAETVAPVVALASRRLPSAVELVDARYGMTPRLVAITDRDPGDEHDGPEAA